MKDIRRIFGVVFVAAMIVCALASCDLLDPEPRIAPGSTNPTGPTTPSTTDTYKPVVYEGYGADGAKYELTITRTSKAAVSFTPETGDSYKLVITSAAGATQTSSGTVMGLSGGKFTLAASINVSVSFEVTVSGSSITNITGTITIEGGITIVGPGTIIPQSQNKTPVAADYDIGNLAQTVGSVTAVTVTAKQGKSGGGITIYYAGASGTAYTKSATLPTAAGTYAVTFDVAAAAGWNAATGLSAGNLVIGTAAQALSVTITGTPGVDKPLAASVQINFAFSGTAAYQWLRDDAEISSARQASYSPKPADSGRKISVKVTCGDKSAASPSVTIPSFAYTVFIQKEEDNKLWAYARVDGGYSYGANADNGFSCQWCRVGTGTEIISGATGISYTPQPADAGKSIAAIVTHSSSPGSVYSNAVAVPNDPVEPALWVEWRNIATLASDQTLKEIAWNIQRAYEANTNGCKTAIDSKRSRYSGDWCIDFYTNEDDEDAQIVAGKLRIHISTYWYDSFAGMTDADRQSIVGAKLAYLANNVVFISEYSGNYGDVRMATVTVTTLGIL